MRAIVVAVCIILEVLCGAPLAAQPSSPPVNDTTSIIDLVRMTFGRCMVVTNEVYEKFTAARPGKCESRCTGCGCNGGPGFRGPPRPGSLKGECVGFADYERICVRRGGCTAECYAVIPACLGYGRAWMARHAPSLGLTFREVATQIELPPLPSENELRAAIGTEHQDASPDARRVVEATRPDGAFQCGTKSRCTEMTSCAEAKFHYANCGLSSLARGGGNPCKALCGSGL